MSITEQFCQGLLDLPLPRSKAMANFVLGLLSEHRAQHPVDAFLSPFCQYTHSNLGKIVAELSVDGPSWEAAAAAIRALLVVYAPPVRQYEGLKYCAFALDVTKICKPHSPALEGRQFVSKANEVIPGNKAITVGYPLSMFHWQGEEGWPLPWRISVPGVEDNLVACGVKDTQLALNELRDTLGDCLRVVEADSSYGQAAFLSPLSEVENLVCIARFRTGTRVWLPAPDGGPTGGAKKVYGEKYYLRDKTEVRTFRQKPSARHSTGLCSQVEQRSIAELSPSEEASVPAALKNGRKVVYRVKRWRDVLIRSKNGYNMKDKPFDVLRIEVWDEATAQLVFDRPMFVAVSGQRRSECSSLFVQQRYRERYDVEPFYCYLKLHLLLQCFQTPEKQHLLNYLLLTQIATWVLWCARDECDLLCAPWQRYLPKNKAANAPKNTPHKPKLTIAQTRRSIKTLFATFDLTPFKPQNCKKGKGRRKGLKMKPRIRHPVLRKTKKSPSYVHKE